jgi:hypothetical protein
METRPLGDLIMVDSCSSGEELEEELDDGGFYEAKKKFNLKDLANRIFVKRDSFIFKNEGDVNEHYKVAKVNNIYQLSRNLEAVHL